MTAAEPVQTSKTSSLLLAGAVGAALLSALVAAGLVNVGKVTVMGVEVTLKKGTPATTVSVLLGIAGALLLCFYLPAVGRELARSAGQAREIGAEKKKKAIGGPGNPRAYEAGSAGVSLGRRLLWQALPALFVIAAIAVMVVAIV
jgi:hypothetical protein